MKEKRQIKCKICGKIFKRLISHIIRIHKISFQEYFNKFYLPYAPKCQNKNCKNPAVFWSMYKGFRKYCSISCSTKGELNNRWKGGKYKNNGYIFIRCETHPRATKLGKYVLEHDLIMEQQLGRLLKKGEIVHHKNGNRSDNRLENLELTTNSKHIANHNGQRIWTEESKKKKVLDAQNRPRDIFGRFIG